MNFPDDRMYSPEHEWILVQGDEVTIGISEFAADSLGDVVYVDLPSEDDEFSAGDTFGEVESVKSVSELYMPVDGVILEINDSLESAPETINADPYGAGWMIRVKLSDTGQLDGLLDAAGYEALVSEK